MKADVAIVGAGAAGLSAALYLSRLNIDVVIVDEYYRPGGRLLGQYYENPRKPAGERIWDGREIASDLSQQALSAGIRIITGVSVWNISPGFELHLCGGPEATLRARSVLLATGAAERAVPVPGWTLPGVMSIGAAQVFANLHGIRPGKKVMVVGVDPLSLTVARELKEAGVDVAGIFLPPWGVLSGDLGLPPEVLASLSRSAGMAPGLILRLAGSFFGGRRKKLGAFLSALPAVRVWGIPIYLRKAVIRIQGNECVESAVTANISVSGEPAGEDPPVPVDAVCISGGLYPLPDLADLAGCPMINVPELGGRVPLHGPSMETPVKGLFVAGNITGIEGAPVAMAQGSLAGAGIAAFLGTGGPNCNGEIGLAMRKVYQARSEAPLKFLPEIEKGRARLRSAWDRLLQGRSCSDDLSLSARNTKKETL